MLILFAALIGPYFINWTSYREDFEREASRILGQKVQVLGSAEARILPFPSVTFNNVRVENAKTGATMMTIRRFSMDAELAPFLRGEILIFDMRIDGPDVTVKLLPDGSLDWAMRGVTSMPMQSVVLENVEVTKGMIDLIDEQHGRTQEIRKLNAKISADKLMGPWHVEGTGALNGHSGAFSFSTGRVENGQLALRTRLLPDEEPVSIETDGEIGFDGAKPRYNGQFTLQVLDLAAISGRAPSSEATKPGGKPAVARATGKFRIDNALLKVDQYRLEVGPTSDPYVVTGGMTVDTGKSPTFMLTANGQQIDIDQLDAHSRTLGSKAPKKGNRMTAPTPAERLAVLHRIGNLIPVPPMPGKVRIRLPALLAGDTTVRDIVIDAEPDGESWKIDKFDGKFPGRTQLEAKGMLKLGDAFGFAGHLLVAARQPSGLADWLTGKVDPRIRLLNGAGLSADVVLSSRTQRFRNLEVDIGPSTINGAFERMVPDGGPPQISLDMSGNSIDLDAARALAGLFTGDTNGLSLADSDVTAHLSAGTFAAFGAQASNVDLTFGYSSKTLNVSRLSIGSLAGAKIELSGKIGNLDAVPSGNLQAKVDAKDIAPLITLAQVMGGSNIIVDRLGGSARALGNAHLAISGAFGSNGVKGTVTGTAGGSALTVDIDRSSLEGALGAVPTTVELTAQNDSVNALISQLGMHPLPIDAPGPGLLSVRVNGTLRDKAHVALSLSGADTSFTANGTGGFPANGKPTGRYDVRLKSDDLMPYLIMNGVSVPDALSGMPVDLRGKLIMKPDSIALSTLEGSVVDNAVTGDLVLSRGQHPLVKGRLSLNEVDARWFAQLLLGAHALTDGKGAWSTSDYAPPPDYGVGFDVTVKADRAYLGYGQPARGFSSEVTLRDGALNFGDVRALWFGGKMSGTLKLVNSNDSALLTTQLVLDGADLSRAINVDDRTAPATGKLDLSASIEGSGRSTRALVDALNGSGSATFSKIVLNGIRTDGFDTILAGADAKNFKVADAQVRRLAQNALSGGSFDVGTLSLPFTVTGGTLRASNISLDEGNASVSGNANLDLASGTVDASFDLAYKPGDDDFSGGTPAVRLSFGGPILQPERSIDVAELSNYLSLRAYEIQRKKVELLQAGVLEKQRLYRKIGLMKYVAAQKAAEEARRRAAEEARRQAEEKARQEAEAAKQKAEEATGVPGADSPGASDPAQPGKPPTDAAGPQEQGAQPGSVTMPESDLTGPSNGSDTPAPKPINPDLNFKTLHPGGAPN